MDSSLFTVILSYAQYSSNNLNKEYLLKGCSTNTTDAAANLVPSDYDNALRLRLSPISIYETINKIT
ncbi:unnamed protein product [Debaryomyces tyrocola]|nr:unnamed protein product [Debaryomyces tyrocola]